MYVPTFKCEYCGEHKQPTFSGTDGVFVPCQCKEARANRDRAHYLEMERRKQAKRRSKR